MARIARTQGAIHRASFPSAKQYVRLSMMGAAAVIPHLAGQDLEPFAAAIERDVADLLEKHRDGEGIAVDQHMSVAVGRV